MLVHFSPFKRQLQLGSLQDLVHEQESSSKTDVGAAGHSSNQSLACSHLVSRQVLGEFDQIPVLCFSVQELL